MKVKIEQRAVFHKFVELEIEIPDSVETNNIDDYVISIEKEWIEKMKQKMKKTGFDKGTGMYEYDGHNQSQSFTEWRYTCKKRNISGHLM